MAWRPSNTGKGGAGKQQRGSGAAKTSYYGQAAAQSGGGYSAWQTRREDSRFVEELAAASPELQKKLLGEKLYPRVQAILTGRQRDLLPKVTGMLLEMDNSELLVLLESEEQLRSKVEEAVDLLREEEEDRVFLEGAEEEFAASPSSAAGQAVAAGSCLLSWRHGVVGDLDGAESVFQALSVPNPLMAQATLEGRRVIESRSWRIPHGWYALQAGSKPVPPEWRQALKATWPDAPPEDAMRGGIIGGLMYIEEEERTPEQCLGDPWAAGPRCHAISKVISLPRPVSCGGSGGLWPLPEVVREEIVEQLPYLRILYFKLRSGS
eukprot:TRINITY_DN42349_c0_g1_i1.p1 TRINITY_DN42349_c0_g1~~TRINITY_DN42349_c0_g1_i1.p1  ORF type:complete len:322 (-),score=95.30 TRINITY_DN42349_c0_g1_i1:213-1178(-)